MVEKNSTSRVEYSNMFNNIRCVSLVSAAQKGLLLAHITYLCIRHIGSCAHRWHKMSCHCFQSWPRLVGDLVVCCPTTVLEYLVYVGPNRFWPHGPCRGPASVTIEEAEKRVPCNIFEVTSFETSSRHCCAEKEMQKAMLSNTSGP